VPSKKNLGDLGSDRIILLISNWCAEAPVSLILVEVALEYNSSLRVFSQGLTGFANGMVSADKLGNDTSP